VVIFPWQPGLERPPVSITDHAAPVGRPLRRCGACPASLEQVGDGAQCVLDSRRTGKGTGVSVQSTPTPAPAVGQGEAAPLSQRMACVPQRARTLHMRSVSLQDQDRGVADVGRGILPPDRSEDRVHRVAQ
jgi:hypothetical protein